jgi:hypothetical protein
MALAVQREVLVHPEAAQRDWPPVQQQARPGHGDRPDAHRHRVLVLSVPHVQPVQVGVVRGPWPGPGNGEHPGGTRPPGHQRAVGGQQPGRGIPGTGYPGPPPHFPGPGGRVEGRGDRDIRDVAGRRGVQPHRPVQPGVVEEIVEVPLPFPPAGADGDSSRRDRLHAQLVPDPDRDPRRLTAPQLPGHVGLERRVPAGMLGDLDVADPHGAMVGGRVTAQHDAPARPGGRHPDVPLVPDVPRVLALGRVGDQVVVAGRDGHLPRPGQRAAPPGLRDALAAGIEPEAPQPVQAAAVPAAAFPWCQHYGHSGPGSLRLRTQRDASCHGHRPRDARPRPGPERAPAMIMASGSRAAAGAGRRSRGKGHP